MEEKATENMNRGILSDYYFVEFSDYFVKNGLKNGGKAGSSLIA